jgi:hypothetical protein
MAGIWSNTEDAVKMIARKAITAASATIPAAAGECGVGRPGTSVTRQRTFDRIYECPLEIACLKLLLFCASRTPFEEQAAAREVQSESWC